MTRKYDTKIISIDEFSSKQNNDKNEYLLGFSTPKNCYNIKVKEGRLIRGGGLDMVLLPGSQNSFSGSYHLENLPSPFLKMWEYKYNSYKSGKREYIMVGYGKDKNLYYKNLFSNESKEFLPMGQTMSTLPSAFTFLINNEEVMGFINGRDKMVVWYCDAEPYTVDDAPKFISICLHNNRLFAIEKANDNYVRYTSTTNPLDWKDSSSSFGAGRIELNDFRGQLKKVVSFKDDLLVFCDFGISKISTYQNSTVFVAENVYNSGTKIYCNTVCMCGDKVYFLAEDGLYSFDGLEAEKVDLGIDTLLQENSQEEANTCFHNNKLYIACFLNYNDPEDENFKNNVVIEYDILNKDYYIFKGLDVVSMLPVNDMILKRLYIVLRDDNRMYELTDNGLKGYLVYKKHWQSGKLTFGAREKDKIVKEVDLLCLSPVKLTFKSEREKKVVNLKKRSSMQKVSLNLHGKEFEFSFDNDGNRFDIGNMQIKVKVEK